MTAYLPVLVVIVGLLLWFASSNPKLQEAGRLLFFAGVLALAIAFSGRTVALLR